MYLHDVGCAFEPSLLILWSWLSEMKAWHCSVMKTQNFLMQAADLKHRAVLQHKLAKKVRCIIHITSRKACIQELEKLYCDKTCFVLLLRQVGENIDLPHTTLKVTVPREPHLETACRALMHRCVLLCPEDTKFILFITISSQFPYTITDPSIMVSQLNVPNQTYTVQKCKTWTPKLVPPYIMMKAMSWYLPLGTFDLLQHLLSHPPKICDRHRYAALSKSLHGPQNSRYLVSPITRASGN